MKRKTINVPLKVSGLEEINSPDGYMGIRHICIECHGECSFVDNYCRWCGSEFPKSVDKKVVKHV